MKDKTPPANKGRNSPENTRSGTHATLGTQTAQTQVDLGDDLLDAKTRALELALEMPPDLLDSLEREVAHPLENDSREADGARAKARPLSLPEISGQFQSASILLREGMLEEAKRVLRRILLADERHGPSRKLLDEIHERELKQIFAVREGEGAEPIRPRSRQAREARDRARAHQDQDDPDRVLDALDRELGLGLAASAAAPPPLTLFSEFEQEAPASVPGINARDRIDLGVAFMEMGFVELAARQFEFACRALMLGQATPETEDSLLAGTGLLARAQIEGGHPFQATLNIEPLLRDTDVPLDKKLELLYLMGRALEELRQPEQAARWYQQASQLDPEYRDVRARVRSLREKTRS